MDHCRTLAVDIGGTGIKLAVLDGSGQMIGQRVRLRTPPQPVAPATLVAAIEGGVAGLGEFDRASIGFPGVVRNGHVLTAPNLGTALWVGFDLQTALAEVWRKPVRVMNDADVQGFGAIQGKGVEMVLTLGTGAGTAIFNHGQIMPHLEFAHHPIRNNKTYEEYVGKAALAKIGKKRWNKRVARVIDVLHHLVNFDHLYIGGGNAKHLRGELPTDVTIIPNSDGLTGGIALWHAEDAEHGGGETAGSRSLKRIPISVAVEKKVVVALPAAAVTTTARRARGRGDAATRGKTRDKE